MLKQTVCRFSQYKYILYTMTLIHLKSPFTNADLQDDV